MLNKCSHTLTVLSFQQCLKQKEAIQQAGEWHRVLQFQTWQENQSDQVSLIPVSAFPLLRPHRLSLSKSAQPTSHPLQSTQSACRHQLVPCSTHDSPTLFPACQHSSGPVCSWPASAVRPPRRLLSLTSTICLLSATRILVCSAGSGRPEIRKQGPQTSKKDESALFMLLLTWSSILEGVNISR